MKEFNLTRFIKYNGSIYQLGDIKITDCTSEYVEIFFHPSDLVNIQIPCSSTSDLFHRIFDSLNDVGQTAIDLDELLSELLAELSLNEDLNEIINEL